MAAVDREKRTLFEHATQTVTLQCSLHHRHARENPAFPIDIALGNAGLPVPVVQPAVATSVLQLLWGAVQTAVSAFLNFSRPRAQAFLEWHAAHHQATAATPPLAFHDSSMQLAVARTRHAIDVFLLDRVRVPTRLDLERMVSSGTAGAHPGPALFGIDDGLPVELLCHECMGAVHALAWQPCHRECLAVAHTHGICIWQRVDSSRSRALAGKIPTRDGKNNWMPTQCPWPSPAAVTALAWHPKGTLLAAAGVGDLGFYVLDAFEPTRPPEHVWASHTGTHLLRWSPSGHFLLVGHCDGNFSLFETLNWQFKTWNHQNCGPLVDAVWGADSAPVGLQDGNPMLLLVFANQISTLQVTSDPPALNALLMTLDAPQVFGCMGADSADGRRAAMRGSLPQPQVSAACWDATRNRLALCLTQDGPEKPAGLLFSTEQHPVFSAMQLAPLHLPSLLAGAAHDGAGLHDARDPPAGMSAGASVSVNGMPLGYRAALHTGPMPAHGRSSGGALLVIRCGMHVSIVPIAIGE